MSRLLLLGAGGPAGTWTSVFTWSTSNGDDTGNSGYTLVNSIPLASFSQTGGTQIRLTIEGPAGSDLSTTGLWVGNGGGTDGFDFTGDQVQLLVGGSGSFTVPATTDVVTDAAAFVKDGTNPLVIAIQLTASAIRRSGTSTTASSWYKFGADASTQNKSTYTSHLAAQYFKKIELFL